jgi:putative ABC transport system permease protein
MEENDMRAIKHAFLSLIRKPTKAIMIFVILFVVFGLVFTGIIIQNSVKTSKEYVRKELGAVVEMRGDYMKAMEDQLSGEDYTKMNLSASLAKEIAKDPLVKDLYITEMSNATNEELESAISMGGDGEGNLVMAASASSSSPSSSSFLLLGSNTDIGMDFANGTYELTEGRHRSSEDQGRDTLLVSQELASKNSLSVGDSIDLTSSVDKQKYSFEIIGIYKGSPSYLVDQMFASLDSVKKLAGTQDDSDAATSINFQLYDPMDIDNFIKQHKDQMPNDYIILYANDSEYKSLTRPLDLISTIISILLVVVFVAGVIIMLAIITIFVRDRKFEIGLLLSSGEGKLRILSQFVLEILLISVLAFGVAAGASKFSSDYAASWIVKNQLVEDKTQDTGGMFGVSIGGATKDEVKIDDVAREFNVAVDKDVIINLMLLSFGLVILSAGAPLLIILGYKPRESLQD